MFQHLKRGLRQEYAPYGTYSAVKVVPRDVRGVNGLPSELRRSLQTNDYHLALRKLADVMADFDAQIAAARAGSGSPRVTLKDVQVGLDIWRMIAVAPCLVPGQGTCTKFGKDASFRYTTPKAEPNVLLEEARRYFQNNPEASRSLDPPEETSLLMARLQIAARDPAGWAAIEGFDDELDTVITMHGTGQAPMSEVVPLGYPIPPEPPPCGVGHPVPPWLREDARVAFARAWLEVERAREWQRARAAYVLHVERMVVAGPPGLTAVPKAASTYQPRENDRTLGELVVAFKAAKSEHPHRYTPICAALEAVLGSTKPVRAITRPDIKAVIAFVQRIPPNASKRWPKITIAEVVAQADAKGLQPRLAKGSVGAYYDHMRTLFRWALDEEWIDDTPCVNIRLESDPTVKPRAFSTPELTRIFGSLMTFRDATPDKWWVPALSLYQGTRLNELCQLAVADVETVDGVTILNLSEFDEHGVRTKAKSLKNDSSERLVPVHPQIIAAGFESYVEARRAAGDAQLFPRLKPGRSGGHGHEFSKWWGRHLDRIDISDPRATFHSFRHGWREVAGLAGLTDRQVDALGGWAPASQAAKYGRRTVVEELGPLIQRIVYRGFTLPD